MTDITFYIVFNEIVIKNQVSLALKLFFKKLMKNIKRIIIVGLIFIVLGLICGINNKHNDNPYILIGCIWIFIGLLIGIPFYFIFIKIKSSFTRAINEGNERKLTTYYEFNNEGIKYFNDISSHEYKWSAIKGYSIVNDNIFIMISKDIIYSIIIGKVEISDDNYNCLIDLLSKKVEFKKYKM